MQCLRRNNGFCFFQLTRLESAMAGRTCLDKSQAPWRKVALALALTLGVVGCGGSGGDDPISETPGVATPGGPVVQGPNSPETPVPPDDDVTFDPFVSDSCEVEYQNQWVYDNMRDYYLFYDQVPVVDPQSYESPQALLRDIRFEERDPFSFLTDAEASSLQFAQGREFGLGYSWRYDENDDARILLTVDESPFGLAGIERGDIILSVDGLDWDDEALDDGFEDRVFGTPDAPATSTWQIEKRDSGDVVEFDITAAEYSINSVESVKDYSNPAYDGRIGYFVFNRFLATSDEELRNVFSYFNEKGISDLIVDLRYNRGGRVSIAETLSSLIAGDSRAGALLYSYRYNDKYQDENYDLTLFEEGSDLNLSRVVFLTSSRTASASEIVTSGLAPHMEVITIGSKTSGKPYVQRGRDRCGLELNAIEAEGFNAADVSVFGGMPATCFAEDDTRNDFGLNSDTNALEGMLRAGLDYLVFGTCETVTPVADTLTARGRRQAVTETDSDANARQGVVEIGGALQP